MDFNQKLNKDFQLYLDLCSNPRRVFPLASREYALAQCWLDRLIRYPCNSLQDRRIRNIYMAELVACLNERRLKGPFLHKPPAEPLERLDFNIVPNVESDGEVVCELPECIEPKKECTPQNTPQKADCGDDPNCIRTEGGQCDNSIHSIHIEPCRLPLPRETDPIGNVSLSNAGNRQCRDQTQTECSGKTSPTQSDCATDLPCCSSQCWQWKDRRNITERFVNASKNSPRFDKPSPLKADCAAGKSYYNRETCKGMGSYLDDPLYMQPLVKCFNSSNTEKPTNSNDEKTLETSSANITTSPYAEKTLPESSKTCTTMSNANKTSDEKTEKKLIGSENLHNLSSKELEELHFNIRDLLEAISSELRGLNGPGRNKYLEDELARYQKFLKTVPERPGSRERFHKIQSDTNKRSYLLLHLQTDLVGLLTDLGYKKYERKDKQNKGKLVEETNV